MLPTRERTEKLLTTYQRPSTIREYLLADVFLHELVDLILAEPYACRKEVVDKARGMRGEPNV